MKIRQATPADLPQITRLFYETIQTINARDYPQDQIDDWSSWHTDPRWSEKIASQYFIVAIHNEKIVGFASLTPTGYLDFMFTHKDHQRQGIASLLLSELEKKAIQQGNPEITTEASITAKPFFQHHGFTVRQKQRKQSRNKSLENYLMVKTAPFLPKI